jgi:arylsulfatase A-like enzyme
LVASVLWAGLLAGGGPVLPVLAAPAQPPAPQPEFVILIVLEGVDREAVKAGPMPVLTKLAKEGAATWMAASVEPPLTLPAMASLLTGLPVEKHKITWNNYDFHRGFVRAPTMFDYLDLSGGRDSAIFWMDEALQQVSKPEPYTDYQMCGPLKPECNPRTVFRYIREYFRKATSGDGYGHAIFSVPHLLVVHLPEALRAGAAQGWESAAYRRALQEVDGTIGQILDLYKDLGMLDRTVVIVTALNGPAPQSATRVPWVAWGAGIKNRYAITQPVSIMDTGATVLRTLGLETHVEWDSHAVEEIFTSPPRISAAESHGR